MGFASIAAGIYLYESMLRENRNLFLSLGALFQLQYHYLLGCLKRLGYS